MNTKNIGIAVIAMLTIGTSTQSCTTLATSDIGIGIIKNILQAGVNKGFNTYKSKDAFLNNDLISKAMPKGLRDINSVLEKVAPNLVTKQKEYIAEAAAYTVNISKPILDNAVQSLNAQDVTRIMQGQKGIGTQILKEKTQQQLIAAISPKVEQELNKYGIVKTINTALSGTSLIGGLLGNQNTSTNASALSTLASEQLINGLFNIIEDHEIKNSQSILGNFGK